MGKLIDLTGKTYYRLTVIKKIGVDEWRDSLWECKCTCGVTKIVAGGDLKKLKVKSCGCYNKELSVINNTKHGLHSHKLYAVHSSIIQRCTNPNNKQYKTYGEKGITIDETWLDFNIFYSWCIINGYNEGLQLDRIDTTKGYSSSNCQFLDSNTHSIKSNLWRWEKKQ